MQNITTIEELKAIGEGEVVKLPNFDNGAELIVRLRKPDVSMMIIDGTIPNPLIETALGMIENGKAEIDIKNKETNKVDVEKTKKYYQAMKIIAKRCLISPTYDEIETYVGGLNTPQLISIFKFAVSEVKDLESFRT